MDLLHQNQDILTITSMAISPSKTTPSDSTPDGLIKFILATAMSIIHTKGPLNRNKSVTKIDRDDVTTLIKALQSAALQLQSSMPDPNATITTVDDSGPSVRDVIREELSKFRDEVLGGPQQRSFAAVVSGAGGPSRPKAKTIRTPVSRPAIVIESTAAEVQSSKTVTDEWRKTVSFKDCNFAPSKVQPVSKGKVRIEFDEVQQRDEALRKLAFVTSIRGQPAKRSNPLIIVKGISKDLTEDDAMDLITKQNPTISGGPDAIRKRFSRKNRKDHLFNLVLEVQPAVRRQLLELGRVNCDHQRVRVEDFSPFIQCYKCLGFGHTRSKCTSEVQCCSHCSSTDHQFEACPSKDDSSCLKCVNCHRSGKKDLSHSATSHKSCPSIRSMVKRIEARTDYGQ